MHIRTAKELGAFVKARRIELGWSQEKLAEQTGVQRLWIMQFENGKNTAQIGLVFRAMRALDIPLEVNLPQPDEEVSTSVVNLDDLLGDD